MKGALIAIAWLLCGCRPTLDVQIMESRRWHPAPWLDCLSAEDACDRALELAKSDPAEAIRILAPIAKDKKRPGMERAIAYYHIGLLFYAINTGKAAAAFNHAMSYTQRRDEVFKLAEAEYTHAARAVPDRSYYVERDGPLLP